jgi:hypothetical protein
MSRLSDRKTFAKLMRKIFEVPEPRRRKFDFGYATPEMLRKDDNERAEPDLSDSDAGMPDDRDDDDEETKKGTTMKTLMGLAKRYGWQAVAKNLVENGTGSFSETEVTEFLTAVAQKSYPDLKPDVAFSKLYSAQTSDGELARRVTSAARDAGFLSKLGPSTPHYLAAPDSGPMGTPGRATLTPRVSGGAPVDNPKSALDQINELVAVQRAAHPELKEAGAFARVYTDPKNADLAARERAENRPVATW